ncbi:hypothetical protein TorRG33x02_002690 [Trema orientale]|uniref:Uncharacterized protein n=1 Tax=Trema orientale TaxID=63057 RepID=A0A2P5G1Q5_TREOI|nr:hypothetical protein TorRG33x02_002690 [Trema orientale]
MYKKFRVSPGDMESAACSGTHQSPAEGALHCHQGSLRLGWTWLSRLQRGRHLHLPCRR